MSGFRYYNPQLGRFLGRDPIAENGGLNLFAFCANNGVNTWDYLGQATPIGLGPDNSVIHFAYGSEEWNKWMSDVNNTAQQNQSILNTAMPDVQTSFGDSGGFGSTWMGGYYYKNAEGKDDFSWSNPEADPTAGMSAADRMFARGEAYSRAQQQAAASKKPDVVIGPLQVVPDDNASAAPQTSTPATAKAPNSGSTMTGTPFAPAAANSGTNYQAVIVTLPDGTQYMPITTVKNQTQAKQLGVPVGAAAPIFVPAGVNPQTLMNQFTGWKMSNTPANFLMTWLPAQWGGANDYKNWNPPSSSIFDAYGNFMYGATGTSSGAFGWEVQGAGQAVYLIEHQTTNNSINVGDIQSGINAVNNGGTIGVTPVHYP